VALSKHLSAVTYVPCYTILTV